ncbi:MAG: hypothetical protein AAF458_09145 [Pseudomonadota bacterium]
MKTLLTMVIAAVCLGPAATMASDRTNKDLQAVIALQGKPCGKVTGSKRLAENDYIANCSDGNSYRVTANANGRVSVTPQ